MEFSADFVHVQDHAVLRQNWVILDLIFKQKSNTSGFRNLRPNFKYYANKPAIITWYTH